MRFANIMRPPSLYVFTLVVLTSARPQFVPRAYSAISISGSSPSVETYTKQPYQPDYTPTKTGSGVPEYTGSYEQESYSQSKFNHYEAKKKEWKGGGHSSDCHDSGTEQTSFPSYGTVTGGYNGAGTGSYPQATSTITSSVGAGFSGNLQQLDYQQQPSASGTSGIGVTDSLPVVTGLSSNLVEDYANPGNDQGSTYAFNPSMISAVGPSPTGDITSGNVSLPAGCESLNGIGIGWLPDSDNGVPLTTITSALGNPQPCFAGYYAHITSADWDGSQFTGKVAEVKASVPSGKPYPIFVASMMPDIPFSQVPAMAGQVTAVMNELTSQGLTVWLRFAHEMNWYVTDGTYTGTPAEFVTAWGAVSDAVKDNPNVHMYWSPNSGDAASLKSTWYPTQGSVDIVGIDIYPKNQEDFSSVYGDFCDTFSDLPFVVGETGASDASSKIYWLQQLSGAAARTACPNYLGWNWFEYDKQGTDFRVATGGNTEAQSVLGTGGGTTTL